MQVTRSFNRKQVCKKGSTRHEKVKKLLELQGKK